eukprot:COSAG05_NODE_248_length_12946_cov_85.003737_9_plen_71_part_00
MFAATIGGYNQRTQPLFKPQPRAWPDKKKQPEHDLPAASSGQRKAGEVSLGAKKKSDPTRELEKEILGLK